MLNRDHQAKLISLHSPANEKAQPYTRKVERYRTSRGERIVADVSVGKTFIAYGATALDLSSAGLAIAVNKSDRNIGSFKIDGLVTVYLKFSDRHSQFEFQARIRNIEESDANTYRVGMAIEIQELDFDNLGGYEIPDSAPLPGFIYKGYFYEEKSITKVLSIGKDFTIVEIFDHSVLLFPGMKIALHLFLPYGKANRIESQAERVLEIRNGSIVAKLRTISLVGSTSKALSAFLIQQAGFNPRIVRNMGLETASIGSSLRVKCVSSEQEYEDVLDLRWRAYAKANKIDPNSKSPSDLSAKTDAVSTILIAIHDGRTVGSVSVSFPPDDDMVIDTEEALEGGFPEGFHRKSGLIEISRLCIDPTYQGADVICKLFAHVCRVGMISDRDLLITSSDEKLWPLYRAMGFYKTGLTYKHKAFQGLHHDIILYSRERFTHATKVGPLFWWKIYRGIYSYLLQYEVVKRPLPIKVKAYFLLSKIFDFAEPAALRLFKFFKRKT